MNIFTKPHSLQLPWKSLKNIVEYYYMWKTTDRYVQQKRVKAVEAESKLKQVYIPNYAKPNAAAGLGNATTIGIAAASGKAGVMNGNSGPAANGNNNDVITINGGKPCESCADTSSSQVGWICSKELNRCIKILFVGCYVCEHVSALSKNAIKRVYSVNKVLTILHKGPSYLFCIKKLADWQI